MVLACLWMSLRCFLEEEEYKENREVKMHQLTVTLEDLYNGATREPALQKNVICDKREGQGGKKGAVECCPTCQECNQDSSDWTRNGSADSVGVHGVPGSWRMHQS